VAEVGGTMGQVKDNVGHFYLPHMGTTYIIVAKSGHVHLNLSVYGCIRSCTVGSDHVQSDPVNNTVAPVM
jgi:hypothetical protein